jgi:hypothetical protein
VAAHPGVTVGALSRPSSVDSIAISGWLASAPLEGVAELGAGLFWEADEALLIVWGYYDESGEYVSGRLVNMTVGGCFASYRRILVTEGVRRQRLELAL